MRLAREFHRPDWRAMLASMSSCELQQWQAFYRDNFFADALLDAHFAALNLTVVSLACGENTLTPAHFSLLSPVTVTEMDEEDDVTIMALAESVHGGVRYEPESGRC